MVGNIGRGDAVALASGVSERLATGCGCRPVFASQSRELRVLRLPAGATSVLSQPGPNPANDNSAIVVTHQARCADPGGFEGFSEGFLGVQALG